MYDNRQVRITTIMYNLFQEARDTTSTFNGLQSAIGAFRDVVDTFETLVKSTITDAENSKAYRDDLQQMIDTLRGLYDIGKYKLVYIDPGRMTKNVWGGIFWKFLHTSSVLLQYAYYKDRVGSFLNFPALLYNIDKVLPCPVCIEHYTHIKPTAPILNIIEQSSFGLLITAVYRFHTVVNNNHKSSLEKQRTPFRDVDFALLYHCFPRSLTNTEISVNFIKQPVIFHSRQHVTLCLFLSLCYSVNLFHVSNLLMRRYGTVNFDYEPVAYLEDRDIKFALPENDKIETLIEYCTVHKRPPTDCRSEYFKNIQNFRNVAHYWSIVIKSSDYELRLDNGSLIEIKNNDELTTVGDDDNVDNHTNPAMVNNSFSK